VALDAAESERVWDRMQTWALKRFGDELGAALKEHMDARGVGSNEHPATDEDISLALCWLLIDRALADGTTPAQLYARLAELTPSDRDVAARIAASGLGLHRVKDVDPGASIVLENVLTGKSIRVSSPNVSCVAVRWHVLLCRVMGGGPTPSLWGPAGFYEPAEEAELVDELRRIAGLHELGTGTAALQTALRVGAGELVCFVPPSRRAERVPYTLEGDPVVMAEAFWRLHDASAAFELLRETAELSFDEQSDDDVAFDWLVSRRRLLVRRPLLPMGAICLESGPILVSEDGELELQDLTSLGTFTLRGDRLEFFGMSEKRLDDAVTLIERRLGKVAGRAKRRVRSIDHALATRGVEQDAPSATRSRGNEESSLIPDARIRELTYRRWVDDPNEHLAGLTPRAAAARGEHRDELERQLRSFEHHSARERADGLPGPEVTWLRVELSLDADRMAA
jgi:hypothetical protein